MLIVTAKYEILNILKASDVISLNLSTTAIYCCNKEDHKIGYRSNKMTFSKHKTNGRK